jgi:channel protein (hemolysin III family)
VSVADPIVRAIPGFCQPVAALSHLVAAAGALVAALPLVRLAKGSPIRTRVLLVYAACVVTNLGISGTYHALSWDCAARPVMQRCDHFAVWLLIAGTFTAVHGVRCHGFWRSGVIALVWSYAICGVLLQVFWFRIFSSRPGLFLYLGFGSLSLVSTVKLGREIGYRAVRPIWYAGILYASGALLESFGHRLVLVQGWIGSHEIFHLAVVAGVIVHWSFIRALLIKHRPVAAVVAPMDEPLRVSL